MAKGIYVGVNNKARKVKKGYVGRVNKKIAIYEDFDKGIEGWINKTNNYTLFSESINGINGADDKCAFFQITNIPSGNSIQMATVYFPIELHKNHVYYGYLYTKGQTKNNNYISPVLRLNKRSTKYNVGNSIIASANPNLSTKETWNKGNSLYGTIDLEEDDDYYDYNAFEIEMIIKAPGTPFGKGQGFYVDKVRVWDLTEIYGEGNEPTQEWCDENKQLLEELSQFVARKVKKGYIGVGGIARPFFSGEGEKEISYYGTTTDLSQSKYMLAATTVGDYALFGGGYNYTSSTYYATVDTYTSSLVKGTASNLSVARESLAATTVGNYALFAGGIASGTAKSTVDTYTSSLVKGTATGLSNSRESLAATTVGNYALFGGGRTGNTYYTTVDTYTSSLAKGTATALSVGRGMLAATTIGDYAIFGGGSYYSNTYLGLTTVDTYTSSLVKGTATELSNGRYNLSAATVGDYALFAGGYKVEGYTSYATVDTYTSSLVKGTATDLSIARKDMGATTLKDYAIFAYGGKNSGTNYSAVDAYNSSLVKKTLATDLPTQYNPAATTVGNYALFGGGRYSSNYFATVHVYQIIE